MDDDARTLLELLGRAVEKREQAGVHQQALVTQIAHTTFEAEQACERLLEEQRKELAAFRAAELARAKEKADAIVAAARAEEATACARIEERQQRFESECASEREQLEALAAKEEEIQARVAAMNACVAADRPHEFVELRVGGQLFETTICNLTRCPHSVLAVLWHQHSTGKDSSGPLRVDGDPSHFHLILSYLRSGKLPITTDVSQLQWLEAQADEYKLNGKGELADLCRAHRRRNPLRSPTLSPFGGGGAPGFGMKPATAPGAFGSLTSSNRELGSSSTSTELPCNKGTGAADDVRTDSTCTELPAYQPVPERDHKTGSLHYYVSITTMPQYQNVSFEELRYKDYIKGNKGVGPAIRGFGTTASSLFELGSSSTCTELPKDEPDHERQHVDDLRCRFDSVSISKMPQNQDLSLVELRYALSNKGNGAADDVRTGSACTELPAYQPVPERDHKTGSLHYYVSITTMPQYQNVSFEELRYKDYIKGNKGAGNAICGFGTPASSLFGAPAASPSQGLF